MNKIIERIFKYKVPNFDKLVEFGFQMLDNKYVYSTLIVDNEMKLTVTVDMQGNVFTEVFDIEINDIYTLFLADEAVGTYVGQIRQEYEEILTCISVKCFFKEVFVGKYAKAIIDYVKEKYGDELEFLWQKFSDNAIIRRQDNLKWYGVMLKLSKRKLGFDSDEIIDILDLRMRTQDIENLKDNNNYFPGYHMNKKHWITIILDGSVCFEEICKRLDESYCLAAQTK